MGFRFRKSFKAGPFRATLSKSGISTSVGVKGARFTNRADGKKQTTATIPGTGISFVSTTNEPATAQNKKKGCLGGCATCIGVVLLLFVLGAFAGGGKEAPSKMQNDLPTAEITTSVNAAANNAAKEDPEPAPAPAPAGIDGKKKFLLLLLTVLI